jgi:hypothetical protein
MNRTAMIAAFAGGLAAAPAAGLDGAVQQVSPHMGEMTVTMDEGTEAGAREIEDSLRFEPWQMVDDLFMRDDYVLLMRHGPTDWSKLDEEDVAPTDCANQRVMSPEGAENMRDLGALMAANGLFPGKIVVSEWCRNQQTLDNLVAGMEEVVPDVRGRLDIETDPDLNLLLALQGAPDVTGLRERVETWDGSGGNGPLLLITHFTNIEELTTFNIYEGEMLMVDPDRDGRVLGYLRLRSARPDIGHFAGEAESREAVGR